MCEKFWTLSPILPELHIARRFSRLHIIMHQMTVSRNLPHSPLGDIPSQGAFIFPARQLDLPAPDCDSPAHQGTSGIAIFVSHNHSTGSPMNGALSLMPVSEETETIPFASTLTLPFTLAVSV